VNRGVSISTGGITIRGAGWQEFNGYFGQYPNSIGSNGTVLTQTQSQYSAIWIAPSAAGVTIRDIAFTQTQPPDTPGWTPTFYPATISVAGQTAPQSSGAVLMENLYFWSIYGGISVGSPGAATGRTTMRHIYGMFFNYGIFVQYANDTVTIDDVHIWWFDLGRANAIKYMLNNTTGILSYRNDNPMISNIFVYGCNIGIHFGASNDGATQRIHLVNADFDNCNNGIVCDASTGTTSGQFANITHTAPTPPNGVNGSGLVVQNGNFVLLDIVNFRCTNAGANGVRLASGGNVNVSITNCWIEGWNQGHAFNSSLAYPAVECDTPCAIYLSGRFLWAGGINNPPAVGGSGSINASHAN
jgi:hypothetical protein